MILRTCGWQLCNGCILNLCNTTDSRRKLGPVPQRCGITPAPGQDPPSPTNPHKSLDCNNIKYTWPRQILPRHGDRLEISIISKSGGRKKYLDEVNDLHTRTYSGSTSRTSFSVTFDLLPPTHCLNGRRCPADRPYACKFVPDVTKVRYHTHHTGDRICPKASSCFLLHFKTNVHVEANCVYFCHHN